MRVEKGQTAESRPPVKEGAHLPRNVWTLAWVAFLNDIATEMSYWLLPQFLIAVLGAPPLAFGLIEGGAETVASFARLLSGWLSDRLRRRKPLVAIGYTAANVVKPLLAVTTTWRQVFWIRSVDRAAKGLRGSPRDALIADSVDAAHRGAAFGLRQAMDTAGAIMGPLAALVLLPLLAGNVRNVFWLASVPGLASLVLAWVGVKEIRPAATVTANPAHAHGQPRPAFSRQLWLILIAVGLFSLGNSSDLFLVLRAQNLGLSPKLAPALGMLFNVVYAALSWPAGKLSDRIPRRWLICIGYLIYAGVYAGFTVISHASFVWPLFAIYGSYYALTEGVIKAWVADLVPSTSRASVFGIFSWVVGLAALPASLLAGWIWQHYSPAAPFALGSLLALLAAVLLFFA